MSVKVPILYLPSLLGQLLNQLLAQVVESWYLDDTDSETPKGKEGNWQSGKIKLRKGSHMFLLLSFLKSYILSLKVA